MLPKTFILAAAWSALFGSFAQAASLGKFARSAAPNEAPAYCQPVNLLQGWDDFYWLDISEGMPHSAHPFLHLRTRS
jgi:hypothetical protein